MKSASKSEKPAPRRFRTLGLSLAILSTAALYGVWPIMPIILVLIVNARGHGGVGMEFVDSAAWIDAGLGVVTLIACVAAWIGRPPRARWTLIVLVWVVTVLRLVQTVQSLTTPTGGAVGQVGGSLSIGQPVALCQIPLLIILPLYITWYMNRAPARAFYAQTPSNR